MYGRLFVHWEFQIAVAGRSQLSFAETKSLTLGPAGRPVFSVHNRRRNRKLLPKPFSLAAKRSETRASPIFEN